MIADVDSILIGASNGLLIFEGLRLFAEDRNFAEMFPETVQRYWVRSII